MPTLLKGDAQCFSIPGVRGGALLGLSSWGRGRGAGSRPSGSHAGLFLSQRSCYQSPFQRSRYGASPALSAESLLDASRGTGSQSGPASLQKGPVGGKETRVWKIQVYSSGYSAALKCKLTFWATEQRSAQRSTGVQMTVLLPQIGPA